jgi:hypothetical protein
MVCRDGTLRHLTKRFLLNTAYSKNGTVPNYFGEYTKTKTIHSGVTINIVLEIVPMKNAASRYLRLE